MNRFLFLSIGIASVMGMIWGCSSGGSKGVQGSGGSTLKGPFIGALFSGGRAEAKLSGNLQGDGTMDLTVLSAPFPQMQTKVASDGSFAQDTTVQGYAIHYEGKVELQPGSQHKFVVSGTFTSNGVGSAGSGTFVLRSLDWQVLDGVKDQMGTSSLGGPPRLAFASESLGFASWTSSLTTPDPLGADTSMSPVWRTDNGGDTWNLAGSLSGSVSDMRFAGGKLWASTSTGLWVSLDQGQSFASVMRAAAEIQSDSTGFGVGTLLMDFFDANHGAILSLNTGKVWVTSDGAKTWVANALLSEPGSAYNDAGTVQMLSPTEAVALVPSFATQYPALFRTSDAGQTWKKVNPGIAPVVPTSSTGSGLNCQGRPASDVRFIDSTRGWASAGQCLAATEDGGVTWTWSGTPVSCGSTPRLLAATPTRVFVGCAYGTTKVTLDGGATFNDIPEVTSSVVFMKVMPDGTGLLGSNDRLYVSNDGGATWTLTPATFAGVSSLVPISSTEWWTWSSFGLEHVSQSGGNRELVMVSGFFSEMSTTADDLWVALDPTTWLALPLAGGGPRVFSASGRMWPLSRTTLVAELQPGIDQPEQSYGLGLSTDGGLTWRNIPGLSEGGWRGCAVDATRAWFARQGAFYLLDNGTAQLVHSSPNQTEPDTIIWCDANRLWFLDDGVPVVLAGGVATEQAVPMEWRSSKASSLLNGEATSNAISDSAAWLALPNGRILRTMNDVAYATYQGSAVLGTAPATASSTSSNPAGGTKPSTSSGTAAVSGNRAPTLGEIGSVAHYNYDVDGNYMGGTIQLSTSASDPDGDRVTISWALETHSGGPSLASTTGNSNILMLDSFASGNVRVTASDGKGGSDTRSFGFSRPAGSH